MTYLIAAAGTGGHVFPGLAVGEALVAGGVGREEVIYVGGGRLEAKVYPDAGFPFLALELRGLRRSLTPRNLSLPRVVWRARDALLETLKARGVRVALAMGGYVTIPTALATRRDRVPLFLAEQNAVAGLANRVASRWATRVFTSFPTTDGLEQGEWVGNPVRAALSSFDRERLRPQALSHYGLEPNQPVLGIFGGSLGAGVLNAAAFALVERWDGPPLQVLHLTGRLAEFPEPQPTPSVNWAPRDFEERMELFYAATDLVIARAGGGVAELTVTGTPSILVPGEFGSSGHQAANAALLARAGAAVVLTQSRIGELPSLVRETLFSTERLEAMRAAAGAVAKPDAAARIATAMMETAG